MPVAQWEGGHYGAAVAAMVVGVMRDIMISQQRRRNADRNSTVEIESFKHHM